MKKHTFPLQPATFYLVFNRGNNGQQIFLEEQNYPFFLSKVSLYILPIAKIYAYALLSNHFHLLIQTKREEEIEEWAKNTEKKDKTIQFHISNQFNRLFKSYSLSINKKYNRTGGLFEEPFKRIPITSDANLVRTVLYLHFNPQNHGFVSDFKVYKHTSFHSFCCNKPTQLAKEEVLNWFYGLGNFMALHNQTDHDFLNTLHDDF